jgi:hypothetical protein
MTDKNNFGNNAETPASDLPAELVEKLKGQSADKTPVLSKRPDTKNPPKESGAYRLESNVQAEIQQSISKVFDPRARQVLQSPLTKKPSDIEERESLYPPAAANDIFSEIEKERDEISKRYPRTPAPESGKDTDYPREADTNRPPAPGFVPPSSLNELQKEDERQDNTPTPVPQRKSPVPDGQNRKVSGQYQAQNIYDDATFSGTPRFASPKTPQGNLLKKLEKSSTRVKVRSDIFPEGEDPSENTDTIIDKINKDIKP